MLDGLTIVYRSNVDLYFYIMGSSHENEVYEAQNMSFIKMRISIKLLLLLLLNLK